MSELVWYFAYGSNMQPATFGAGAASSPRGAVPARLRGWQLVFDKPPILPVGGGDGERRRDAGGGGAQASRTT